MNFCMAENSKTKNLSFQNQCTHQFEFGKIQKSLGANVQIEKSGDFQYTYTFVFSYCRKP